MQCKCKGECGSGSSPCVLGATEDDGYCDFCRTTREGTKSLTDPYDNPWDNERYWTDVPGGENPTDEYLDEDCGDGDHSGEE